MSVQGSVLVLHRGARSVSLDELREVRPPAPVGRWHPIAHARVVDVVTQAIGEAGYVVRRSQFGLTPDGHRCFGTLDLDSALAHGVGLSVGIRNSSDKSFPLGFCAGSRVFCCDNLAFRAELLVKRKHTRYGEQRFVAAIAGAVTSLKAFQEVEAERIERFARTEVSPDAADALILRAFERGIIGRELPKVIREWRSPEHAEFRPRTLWSLFNAFTSGLKERSLARPAEYAVQTMRLNGLLDAADVAHALPPVPPADPSVAV